MSSIVQILCDSHIIKDLRNKDIYYGVLSSPSSDLIEIFNRQGITLLVRPRKSLELLRVYKNELNQPNVIRGQGRIEDFIALRSDDSNNSPFQRPVSTMYDTPTYSESGGLSHQKNINIGVEFLGGVFQPLLVKLGIDVSAKIAKDKILAATFTLSSFHSEEIDNAALENNLQTYKVRNDKLPQFANSRLFITTGVYYCDMLEISLAELDAADFNFLTSSELVKAGITVKTSGQGYNQISYKERVAFGARFAWLDFSILRDIPIKVYDVPSDERLTPLMDTPERPVLPYVDIEDI